VTGLRELPSERVRERGQPPVYYGRSRQGRQWPRRRARPVQGAAVLTQAGDGRALRLAVLAITAQPGACLSVAASESLRPFTGTSALAGDPRSVSGARPERPYWAGIDGYQHIIFLPGPVPALAVPAGWLIPRRRTAETVVMRESAVILMIIPTAGHEYSQRYAIACVPPCCIAAALALRRPASQNQPQPRQPGGPR
jgi:hypothetical protein